MTFLSPGIPGAGDTELATEEKQDQIISELTSLRGFDIPPYDEISMAYTGDNLTSVVYKMATVTQATLTLSYTGDKLTGVVIS